MPRKKREELIGEDALAAIADAPDRPVRLLEGGSPNSDYFRWLYGRILEQAVTAAEQGKSVANLPQMLSGFRELCDMHGVDADLLAEQKSETVLIREAIDRLLETPEALFELEDRQIDLLDQRMTETVRIMGEFIDRQKDKASIAGVQQVAEHHLAINIHQAQIKKKSAERILTMIEKVRRLRRWAREAIPSEALKGLEDRWDASRTLRFMLYVGRSNISKGGEGNQFYTIGKHHCAMAFSVWKAKYGIHVGPFMLQKGAYYGAKGVNPKYDGCIIVCPPGHGKSDFAAHEVALWIIDNPYEQVLVGHAKEDKASDQMRYTSAMFDMGEPVGRRRHALFPHIKVSRKKRPTTSSLHLDVDQTLKAPALRAHGINEAISGSNATKMLLDDPVDEKEAEEPSTRDRKYNRICNTWLTRLRGSEETFTLVTATIWHEDDAVSRLVSLADAGKARYVICWMPAGGPDKFKPVWPEMYPAAYLKSKYAQNPQQYQTVYMMKPAGKSGKIVNAFRWFDPQSEEHQEFIGRCAVHVTVDPSATNRQKSDRHGVLFVGVGELRQETALENGGKQVSTRRVARILSADSIHAAPVDVLASIAARAAAQRVDYLHIETVGGFGALADVAENLYDMPTIRHTPTGQGSKEQRLRSVAPMIDASLPGMIPCVEFPHAPDDPTRPHDDIRWLTDQILRFGSTKADDGVDALTQLLKHLSGELSPGEGAVTQSVRASLTAGNPALAAIYSAFRKQREMEQNAEVDDYLVLEH